MSKILENRDYFLKENITGKENHSCKFRYYSDDENLYFQFIVEDEDIISPYQKDNEDLYNADAVEVFISEQGSLEKYNELEVSPFGLRFYAEIINTDGKTPKLEKKEPTFEVKSEITENGYKVDIVFPYKILNAFNKEKMKMNVFRLDKKEDGRLLLYALNPTLCESFHRPKFFL